MGEGGRYEKIEAENKMKYMDKNIRKLLNAFHLTSFRFI